DWFLLASDMTGMAALEVNLERLPPEAQGHACIEVLSPEDQRALAHPDGIQIEWIVNPRPSSDRSPLADAVEAVSWRDGRASAWVATEFASMRRIRRYLRDRGLGRDDMYISSYWKLGDTDEGHKAAKKNDGEA
ncbi:MAG: siderophore-interacting protein, partial [Myxococcota bacterium]